MSYIKLSSATLAVLTLYSLLGLALAHADQEPDAYKIIATTQTPAAGRIDYVSADSENRRVYVACGNRVNIFDLDSYKLIGSLPNASGHGVAIDSENHRGLVSGDPAILFDTGSLKPIKSIPAPGADGYIFDAFTHHFFILSHRVPNLLVIDSKDGAVIGKIDAIAPGGANAAVEQGVSDDKGRLFFDVANLHHIAVVDARTLKVSGHFDLGEKGIGPAGLAIDRQNKILFAMCRGAKGGEPCCVILSAADGKLLKVLPLAGSSDGAAFNPKTGEVFSSHGNGTLSIIKENGPADFISEQTLQTKPGAKTCTLDAKTGHIILIALEAAPVSSETTSAESLSKTLDVIFVGK